MKLLIKTNPQTGKVEVLNKQTGRPLHNISRIDIYVNTFGKAEVYIGFKNVDIDIESNTKNET